MYTSNLLLEWEGGLRSPGAEMGGFWPATVYVRLRSSRIAMGRATTHSTWHLNTYEYFECTSCSELEAVSTGTLATGLEQPILQCSIEAVSIFEYK